jgi:hypothetical protein
MLLIFEEENHNFLGDNEDSKDFQDEHCPMFHHPTPLCILLTLQPHN